MNRLFKCSAQLVFRSFPRCSLRSYATGLSETRYGQPLPSTHPHLFQSDAELTPGIRADEYEARRRALVDRLPAGSVAIALGASLQYSSGGIFYRFRQQSDLFYLCGWQEPDSALILEKTSTSRGYRMTLYIPPKDEKWEAWHGPRTGFSGATSIFGADDAVDIDLFPARLKAFLSDKYASGPLFLDVPDHLATANSSGNSSRRSFIGLFSQGPSPPDVLSAPALMKQTDALGVTGLLTAPKTIARGLQSLSEAVAPLRVVKSKEEIKLMRQAAEIAANAHAHVMGFADPHRLESAMAAHFEYHCALSGPVQPAFLPVCASGDSTLTVHYVSNDRLLQDDALVLFDGGCVYGGYASDLTRTFPVSGTFNEPQRDLYAAVLAAAKAVAKLCTVREGRSLRGLHRESVEVLRRELAQLGMTLDAGVLERRLYPHFVGHFLGLDLHDTPSMDRSARLQAGMTLAIEPGLYIPQDDAFPKHFQGLSVRIEDEILVQEDDYILLSANCPREIIDVEATCQRLLDKVRD